MGVVAVIGDNLLVLKRRSGLPVAATRSIAGVDGLLRRAAKRIQGAGTAGFKRQASNDEFVAHVD